MPSGFAMTRHAGTHGYQHEQEQFHDQHHAFKQEYCRQWSSSSSTPSPSDATYGNSLFILSPPFDIDSPKRHSRVVSPNSVQVSTPFASFPMEAPVAHSPVVATPLTRFLNKQNLGYIPKSSHNESGTNSFQSGTTQSLPSLVNSLQSSSHQKKRGFSAQAGETLNHLFSTTSLNKHPITHTQSLPPLKRANHSPSSPLPSISSIAVCPPLRYLRSQSCPSDTMVQMSSVTEEESIEGVSLAHLHQHEDCDHRSSPHYSDTFSMGRMFRSNSFSAESAMDIRAAHAHRLHDNGSEQFDNVSSQHPKSVNGHSWIGRNPLASLATESTHRWQLMKDNQRLQQNGELQSRSHSEGDEDTYQDDDIGEYGDEEDVENGTAARRLDLGDHLIEARRDKKLCGFTGCQSNAVTRGLCISHGGGRRCQLKGCTRGAQSKGLCVAHGGGRICREKGCSNIQRSMGLCIRHGGGKRCSVPGCEKGVVRQDLCTAHGGKRKCRVSDCNKHVKRKGLCRSHANSMLSNDGEESTASHRSVGMFP